MARSNRKSGNVAGENGERFSLGDPEPGRGTDNGTAPGNGDAENATDGSADASGADVQETAQAEPETVERTEAAEQPKRRRGRPKGSKNSANAGAKNRMDRESIGLLAQQIQAFHTITATAFGVPEMEIGELEATLLASSIGDLQAHYGPMISGPAMLWLSFAGVAGMVYVPRLTAIRQRIKEAKRKAQPEPGATVIRGDFSRAPDDMFKPGSVG